MDVTRPYEFIWFGDIHGTNPYTIIGFRWAAEAASSAAAPLLLQPLPQLLGDVPVPMALDPPPSFILCRLRDLKGKGSIKWNLS